MALDALNAFMQDYLQRQQFNQVAAPSVAPQQPALFGPNGGFTPYGQQNFPQVPIPPTTPWGQSQVPSSQGDSWVSFLQNILGGGANGGMPATGGAPQPALFGENGGFTPYGRGQMQNFQMPPPPPWAIPAGNGSGWPSNFGPSDAPNGRASNPWGFGGASAQQPSFGGFGRPNQF